MVLKYKTGNLPPNFIYLGIMLLGVGVWRIAVSDWKGILFFVVSLVCLFMKSGIIIDIDNRRLKKYVGFLMIKKGEWEDIRSFINLQITRTKETQSMNVLSVSRNETKDVYKLFMVLPDKRIELMSGEKDCIFKRANEISSSLQTSIIYESNICE